MARPDPALLNPARYPFHCTIEPRFGDLDVNMHINNVAIAGLLEDGRVRFHRASDYHLALQGLTSMMASIAIEYLGQGHYPEPLDVHAAIAELGRTSHQLVQILSQGGKPVAFARSVVVTIGSEGPAPFPASFAEAARQWMLRP